MRYVYVHDYTILYVTMHLLVSRINQLLKVRLDGEDYLVKATSHAEQVFSVKVFAYAWN